MNSEYNDMSLFDFIVLCLRKLKQFFVWLEKGLRSVVAICWKRWYIISAGVILGVVFAWFWAKPQFTRFTGEATIVFPEGMKGTIEEGLECFGNLSPDDKFTLYGIPYEAQQNFKSLQHFNWIDAKNDGRVDYADFDNKVSADDTLNTIAQDRLEIRLKMRGYEDFQYYERALGKYFSSQAAYAEPARRWRESRQRLIDEMDREIARTDSFVDYDYFHRNHNVLVVDSFSLGQQSLMHYRDMNDLRNQREAMVEQLASTPDVVNFQTHIHLDAMYYLHKYIYSVIAGFALALITAFIIEYRNNIHTYLHPEK